MSILVVANDVIPGFGVPVAAPGIRAAGLVEGLRSHGFEVEVTVPATVLDSVWRRALPPSPPPGATVLDPRDLQAFVESRSFERVVFTNANMAPHLAPIDGTSFVFDLFAPKILELLASDRDDRNWLDDARRKERAFALADHVLVNGRRKLGYALGWLLRPEVARIRTDVLGLPAAPEGDPLDRISIAEMAVPLPPSIDPRHEPEAGDRLRVGMAGYAQAWSTPDRVMASLAVPLERGHDVHVLAPRHWGGADTATAELPPLPADVTRHEGPLGWADFARWIQSMDVIVDQFPDSAERRLAMITRTAVALRLGVPVIHGADSEVSDMIREFDAGWVVPGDELVAWEEAYAEAADPAARAHRRAGARRLSIERLDPHEALADTAAAFARADR